MQSPGLGREGVEHGCPAAPGTGWVCGRAGPAESLDGVGGWTLGFLGGTWVTLYCLAGRRSPSVLSSSLQEGCGARARCPPPFCRLLGGQGPPFPGVAPFSVEEGCLPVLPP